MNSAKQTPPTVNPNLTACIDDYRRMIGEEGVLSESLVHKLTTDPDLTRAEYREGGFTYTVFNAAKTLYTPTEPHQLLAKGLVTARADGSAEVRVCCAPFIKFYNAFEDVAQRDLQGMAGGAYRAVLTRKLDGTLICRWVHNGQVFFSTRGRILNFERNNFWDLLTAVIGARGYEMLLEPKVHSLYTMLFELIGPSNPVLEAHPEDDLVLIGMNRTSTYDDVLHARGVAEALREEGLNVVETYDGEDPQAVMAAFPGVQEGVVVVYVDSLGFVAYRVKHKQDAYLRRLRAKSQATPQRLFDMTLQHGFETFGDAEVHLKREHAESAHLEELLEYYRELWPQVQERAAPVRERAARVFACGEEIKGIQDRKARFFQAQAQLGADAGMAMKVADGHISLAELTARLAKREDMK